MSSKVAVVTGGSSGIGKRICQYLLFEMGYHVIAIARNASKLESIATEFYKQNTNIMFYTISCNVADYSALKSRMMPVIQKLGHIDLLVNAAGYVKRGTSDLDADEFMQMVNTNLVGPFNLTQLLAPLMKKQKSGKIVNIASISGVEARPELGGYSASKFGLMGFNESLHFELAPYGISVTAICPNLVATEMTSDVKNLSLQELMPIDEIIKTLKLILSYDNTVMLKEIVLRNRFYYLKN